MKKFEVGKYYACRSVCDYDCVWTYKVMSRTDKTVLLRDVDTNIDRKYRIDPSSDVYFGAEAVKPLGRYSMCPILTAEKEVNYGY